MDEGMNELAQVTLVKIKNKKRYEKYDIVTIAGMIFTIVSYTRTVLLGVFTLFSLNFIKFLLICSFVILITGIAFLFHVT